MMPNNTPARPVHKTIFDPNDTIFTPSKTATSTLAAVKHHAEMNQSGDGMRIPISDDFMRYAPDVMPGEIAAIIAQTSNYKTGFMQWCARKNGEFWAENGITDRIGIYVSLEETIEEQGYMELARISGTAVGELARGNVHDWGKVELAAVQMGTLPIYRIGFSFQNAESYQHLYLSNIYAAIQYLITKVLDWRPKIGGIWVDYLQALPIDPEIRHGAAVDAQRRLQVREDTFRLRQMGGVLRAPIMVGVQAKQNMKCGNSPIQLPGVYDGEESSSIGQRSDRVYTFWLTKTTHPVGSLVEKGNFSFIVKENGLWCKVVKQRGRLPAGKVFLCEIDYETNHIYPETEFSPRVDQMPDWVIN